MKLEKPLVEIKGFGGTLGLIIDDKALFDQVEHELKKLLQRTHSKGFFQGAEIFLKGDQDQFTSEEFDQLKNILKHEGDLDLKTIVDEETASNPEPDPLPQNPGSQGRRFGGPLPGRPLPQDHSVSAPVSIETTWHLSETPVELEYSVSQQEPLTVEQNPDPESFISSQEGLPQEGLPQEIPVQALSPQDHSSGRSLPQEDLLQEGLPQETPIQEPLALASTTDSAPMNRTSVEESLKAGEEQVDENQPVSDQEVAKSEPETILEKETNQETIEPSVENSFSIPNLQTAEALLVRQTLHSGQSVRSKVSVVLMGDLNAGAEIVSDQNVFVLGSIRGMVHAGASGNRDARVFALRMQPTQIRIAELITQPSSEDKKTTQLAPEVAFIEDEFIYIETCWKLRV